MGLSPSFWFIPTYNPEQQIKDGWPNVFPVQVTSRPDHGFVPGGRRWIPSAIELIRKKCNVFSCIDSLTIKPDFCSWNLSTSINKICRPAFNILYFGQRNCLSMLEILSGSSHLGHNIFFVTTLILEQVQWKVVHHFGAVWFGVEVRKWESEKIVSVPFGTWDLVIKFSGVWMLLGSVDWKMLCLFRFLDDNVKVKVKKFTIKLTAN